jgi:acyl-CoA dehydrogenase
MEWHDESQFQRMIRSSVREIAQSYDREYWHEVHEAREFPQEFWDDLAAEGWVGVSIPEEYGGQGLGMKEMVTVIEELEVNGAWSIGNAFLLVPVFGGETLKAHGTEAQKERWLPELAAGNARFALGLTEPDAGLNTRNISTVAERDGDEFVITGRKIWTSGVHEADRAVVLARTLSPEEADGPNHGLTMFLVDPEKSDVDYDKIELDTFMPEPTFNFYLDGMRVHEDQVIGEVHEGLYNVFDTLNTERIGAAAQMYGAGSYGLQRACEYANEREVFDVPIGSHQAIQHPLADAYADLEVARLMYHKAAETYDAGEPAGPASNIANLKTGEAAWNAIEASITTFGGMSASKEMEVGKISQMLRHNRIAPISEQMLRNYIATKELGLPKSY